MVGPPGLEPGTNGFLVRYSNQLSESKGKKKKAMPLVGIP